MPFLRRSAHGVRQFRIVCQEKHEKAKKPLAVLDEGSE
jgi:hypothetical protein